MAKPTGPLLSFGASGTIAKTQVYSSWRGVSYVRRWVAPAQPRTSAQLSTRDVFSWLQAVWKLGGPDFQTPWTAFASGRPLTNRNAFSSANISSLRSGSDLSTMVFSPGARAGLVAASIGVTPGSGQLTVAVGAPSLPDGWTISKAVAAAIRDQDPHSATFYTMTIGSDSSAPYSIVLASLTASQLYRVSCWFEFTRPDGMLAYGPGLNGSGTPS
jgi:hypothetical protein